MCVLEYKVKIYEGDHVDAADVGVAAVDGAVARGRVQRRLGRALRRVSQEVGVCQSIFRGRCWWKNFYW